MQASQAARETSQQMQGDFKALEQDSRCACPAACPAGWPACTPGRPTSQLTNKFDMALSWWTALRKRNHNTLGFGRSVCTEKPRCRDVLSAQGPGGKEQAQALC